MATNQGFKSFIPKPDRIHAKFLYHWLRTNRAYLDSLGNGATFKEVSKTVVSRIEILIPPLAEQRRIAEILDRTETLRVKRRTVLAKLDTLTQAIFIDMFGDPATNPKGWRRNALCEITCRITDGEHLNPVFSVAGMPMVMAGNVLDDLVDLPAAKKVDPALGEKLRKKCSPEKGDLLLVSRGATIGRLCSIDFTDRFCLMGSVILIKPDRGLLDNKYLSALLKHPLMAEKLYSASGSSAQQAIYLKDIKGLSCPLPPLSLQHEFTRRVAAVEKLKATHRASLAEMDALFASLQHRAFRGEL
jgi:type I restriction enzyme S subunit